MAPESTLDPAYIARVARRVLDEDLGTGDLTARLLADDTMKAALICRQHAVLAGAAFFEAVFTELDPGVDIEWDAADGDTVERDQIVCHLSGSTHAVLSGERSALNLLQTLSATATATRQFVDLIADTGARILDTRKTIPGLRLAQKYAVRCGGGHNHRIGLYDGVLIKENHLRAGRSIAEVLDRARSITPDGTMVEIEVESLDELADALSAGARRVLLDNFTLTQLEQAVTLNAGRAELEASGGVDEDTVVAIARSGVDYISVGAITKDVKAVDFSLLVET